MLERKEEEDVGHYDAGEKWKRAMMRAHQRVSYTFRIGTNHGNGGRGAPSLTR